MRKLPASIFAAFALFSFALSCAKDDEPEAAPVREPVEEASESVPITGIAFDKTELVIRKGETDSLTVVFTPANTTDTDFFIEFDERMLDVESTPTAFAFTAWSEGETSVIVRSAANPSVLGCCEITISK